MSIKVRICVKIVNGLRNVSPNLAKRKLLVCTLWVAASAAATTTTIDDDMMMMMMMISSGLPAQISTRTIHEFR